jgi:5,10-methylenetetrahydromethanopterin reductase
MTRLRVDLRIPVGQPLPDLAAFIARCEEAGFDGIGIHDHPASGRDAYLALPLAARATHPLRLFPATSSPVVRHPLHLASLAHSLDEIAPGRTCLTVAPGFLSTRSIGKPGASVAFMREAVGDLRRLLAGETVAFGPTQSRLRNLSATPPPVYLLAAGPRMTELAGEVADGAFLMVGLHPAAIRAARRRLEQGAQRAGRALEGFPIVFVVTIGLGSDAALGAHWPRAGDGRARCLLWGPPRHGAGGRIPRWVLGQCPRHRDGGAPWSGQDPRRCAARRWPTGGETLHVQCAGHD